MKQNNFIILIFFGLSLPLCSVNAVEGQKEIYSPSLELDFYRRLKNDGFDFGVVDRVDEFLSLSWPQSKRLEQCPLRQIDDQDLIDKLNQIFSALTSSSCKSEKDSYFASFGASVTKLGQFYYGQGTGAASGYQAGYYQNLNDMMSSLSALVGDSRCAFDIKERGLIPVLSDVLGSVSMSALLVPNKYSLFAGIGGLTASASLKIVDSLLKPKFNMSKNEDRENFISLVCSFYEIKTEVEERKFLHIATSKDKQNYLTAHDFAISIDSKIKKLQIEKEAILKELQTLEEDFLLTNLGQEKILFTHNAHKFESFLSSHGDETSWTFRSQLPDVLIEISGLLQNIEFDENRYQSFTDIGADKNKFLDSASLLSDVQVRLYDDQQLAQIFLQPLLRIDEILQAELSRYDEQLQARIVEDELSFAELKTDIEKIFDEKIELLTQSFSKINDYIKKIKVKIDKKNFVADDQGTHIDHLIVKFIKSIEGQFFGHLGWQFYEYLRNGAARELKDFYKYYAKFANKYGLRSNRSIVDEAQRRVACATASDIIVRINNSRSLVNMGADYVFSNRDFFHENVSKIDVHFKVIPTGASIQRQFLTQARSLIKAQEFVASGEKLNFPRVLNNKNVFRHPLLGDLMVGQLLADNQLEKLYEFKSINQCDRW